MTNSWKHFPKTKGKNQIDRRTKSFKLFRKQWLENLAKKKPNQKFIDGEWVTYQ